MSKADPSTPAWVLDVAADTKRYQSWRLMDVMLERGEDVTDNLLWQHRRSQLDSMLADDRWAKAGSEWAKSEPIPYDLSGPAPVKMELQPGWEEKLKELTPRETPLAVTKGDIIRIIPEKGPERVMLVAHVEHHIITLADVEEQGQ